MTDDGENMCSFSAEEPAQNSGAAPQLISARVLLSACGHDETTLQAIRAVFVARLPDDLSRARHAFQRREAAQLREIAHRMFGTLSAFSTRTGALASQLEDFAAAGWLDEAGHVLDELEPLSQTLMAAVSSLTFSALQQLWAAEHELESV